MKAIKDAFVQFVNYWLLYLYLCLFGLAWLIAACLLSFIFPDQQISALIAFFPVAYLFFGK